MSDNSWWTALFGRGRFIGAHIPTLRWTGNFNAAVLLEELIFRFDLAGRQAFTFPDDQLSYHLFMTVSALKQARKELAELGAITTERAGMPAKLHYYINLDVVHRQLVSDFQLTSQRNPANSTIYNQTLSDISPVGLDLGLVSESVKTPEEPKKRRQASPPNPEVKLVMDDYAERRGSPIPDYGRQARAAKWLLDNGYTRAQIRRCHEWLLASDWWQENVGVITLDHVKSRIAAVIDKDEPEPAPKPSREESMASDRESLLSRLRAETAPAEIPIDEPPRLTIDCPGCGGRHYFAECPLGYTAAINE